MDMAQLITWALSITAMIISITTFSITRYDSHKQRKRDKIPKIEIFKINFPKSNPQVEDGWKQKHMRYYYGETKRDISCDNTVRVLEMSNREADNLQNTKRKVYFTDFNDTPCLMLNFLNDKDNIIVEHQSTVITFLNNGSFLKAIAVKSADITYTNGGKVHLNGDPTAFKTFNAKGMEQFDIILDEATNDFQDSICELNTAVYKNAKDGMNILDMTFDSYFLKYQELKFNVIVKDADDLETELEIFLKLTGDGTAHKFLLPNTYVTE